MVLLDTNTTIGIIVYSAIGVIILLIVIFALVNRGKQKQDKQKKAINVEKLKSIIASNPDDLFNSDIDVLKSDPKVIFNFLDKSDWGICKKMSLLKLIGQVTYYTEWGGVKGNYISYNDYYYLDVHSVIYYSLEQCFQTTQTKDGKRIIANLKNYEEGIICYLMYELFSEYGKISSSYSIIHHKGIEELLGRLELGLTAYINSKSDPVFEKCIKKVYEVFPVEEMFKKDASGKYLIFYYLFS